ncbi:hydrogenase maturation nickel metallochaperone HypA [Rugosimonospora acidiphila]|uniref:Hydrogenase maturation factor HypA n=1 Tax=Rugosimonospora acidiphila TaxID=556531 RepID=A0ABP9SHZ5_9ACTN
MHELAIAESIVETVGGRCGDARVTRVLLSVGKLSGVVPDAIRFCFDLAAAGTPVAGARLDIEEPDGWARCRSCGGEFGVDDLILLCPCGSADVEVRGGESLTIRSVEVT